MQNLASPIEKFGTTTHLTVKGLLLGGQEKIFEDKAWAHRAYISSGRWALQYVRDNSVGAPATDYNAWDQLYLGIQEKDQRLINASNGDLLLREQRDVVQSSYFTYATRGWFYQPRTYTWLDGIAAWLLNFKIVNEHPKLGANVGEWLSANSIKNPMPGGPAFRDTVPRGRIDVFAQRWKWINNPKDGMLQIWTGVATARNAPKFQLPRHIHLTLEDCLPNENENHSNYMGLGRYECGHPVRREKTFASR